MKKNYANKPVLTTNDCNKALIEVAKPLTYGGIAIAIIMGIWFGHIKASTPMMLLAGFILYVIGFGVFATVIQKRARSNLLRNLTCTEEDNKE